MRLHLVDGTYELFRAHFAPRPGHSRPGRPGRQGHRRRGRRRCCRCCTTPTRPSPTSRSPSTTPSARSATICSPTTRATRACRPSCARSSTPSRRPCARWASSSGRCASTRPTTRWPPAPAASATQVEQVRIMTPDKDLGQCLRGDRVVQVDRRQHKVTDEAALPHPARLRPRQHARLPGADRRHRRRHPRPARLRREERRPADRRLRAPRGHPRRTPTSGRSSRAAPCSWPRPWPRSARRRCSTASWPPWSTTVPLAESLEDLRFRGVPRARFDAWCTHVGSETLRTMPRRWLE